eukprot:Skav221689  [mRNA]  locus=scaffold1494:301694:310077:+ [translate_table: standard]
MAGRLADCPRRDQLLQWCTFRQVSGFQGRIEKDPDSCYSFWVPRPLGWWVAGHGHRFPDAPFPDILHSYFSVCGLCLCGLLPPLDAMLGMSRAARQRAEARGLLPTGAKPQQDTVTEVRAAASWRFPTWLLVALLVAVLSVLREHPKLFTLHEELILTVRSSGAATGETPVIRMAVDAVVWWRSSTRAQLRRGGLWSCSTGAELRFDPGHSSADRLRQRRSAHSDRS